MTISKKLVKTTLAKVLKLEKITGKNFNKEKALLENLLKKTIQLNENFVADADPDDEQIIVTNIEQDDFQTTIKQIDAEFELYK